VSEKSNRKKRSSPHDTETACSSLSWHELETSEANSDSAPGPAPASPHLSIRTAMATRTDAAPAASSHGSSSVTAARAVKRRNGKDIILNAVKPATQSERLLEGNETERRTTESQGGVGVSDDSASAGSPLSERTSSPFTAPFTAKTPHSVTFEASLSTGADTASPFSEGSPSQISTETPHSVSYKSKHCMRGRGVGSIASDAHSGEPHRKQPEEEKKKLTSETSLCVRVARSWPPEEHMHVLEKWRPRHTIISTTA
jgi:hypothetical protein